MNPPIESQSCDGLHCVSEDLTLGGAARLRLNYASSLNHCWADVEGCGGGHGQFTPWQLLPGETALGKEELKSLLDPARRL